MTKTDLEAFERAVRAAWAAGRIPNDALDPNPHHDDPAVGPNMYAVTEHFIRPMTAAAGGMSYALMLHPGGLECDVFVTHAWAEGVFEFVSKCLRAWPQGATHLWCCFLSNPQCQDDVAALLEGRKGGPGIPKGTRKRARRFVRRRVSALQ